MVLLTGSMSTAARRAALLEIVSGDAGIVIGTHALLQEKVTFCDLGLVVVDEQHRFGVEQRDLLRGKATTNPHLLVMTATPIPRTVAMTVFGDLETSTLTEVPAGRPAVSSHVVALAENPGWYPRVWQRVAEEVGRGHQAYVVCPRIDGDGHVEEADADAGAPGNGEDEAPRKRPLRAVLEAVEELRAEPALAGLRIEALHGRIPAEERERVMAAFAAGQVHVLVATTVIEVGVDVPNATAMVVLDADRFGISQLHQLRGRVGRGSGGGVPAGQRGRGRHPGRGAARRGRRHHRRVRPGLRRARGDHRARTTPRRPDPDLSAHPRWPGAGRPLTPSRGLPGRAPQSTAASTRRLGDVAWSRWRS